MRDTQLSPELSELKNIMDSGLNGTEAVRLLDYWVSEAKRFGVDIRSNEQDKLVALRLQEAGIPELSARNLISEHYSNTEYGADVETSERLEPVVTALLQAPVQFSNGRMTS